MSQTLAILTAILPLYLFLFFILKKQNKMSQQLTDLQQAVTDAITVEESAITLIGGLKTSLDAAIAAQPTDDGAALAELSASLGTEKDKLAAAITANTPAAPGA